LLDQILAKMMARDLRDRYQTASELIVDLERSGLAAPLPSFADPDLALQDPWVRQCMASSTQPTRADLEAVPRPPADGEPAADQPRPSAPDVGDWWHLRRRDRKGRLWKVKATTQQIVQRLRTGKISSKVEASPLDTDNFRPLSAYPAFRDIKPVRVVRLKALRADPETGDGHAQEGYRGARESEETAAGANRGGWLFPVGVGVALLLAVLALVWLFLLGRR
jgi:hypothetical protein